MANLKKYVAIFYSATGEELDKIFVVGETFDEACQAAIIEMPYDCEDWVVLER